MSRTRDAGFTLVELIVAIAIFGIISTVTIAIVFQSEKTFTTTDKRVNESVDRQILLPYFVKDVESASTIATTGGTCGAGGTVIAVITSTDIDALNVSTARQQVYRFASATGVLTRSECVGAAAAVVTTVARHLSTVAAQAPILTCVATCATSNAVVTLTMTDTSAVQFKLEAVRKL
ncbi:MAG: hypothetical protein JWM93_1379 [Frankiales bacterium]|nr:hypothetical protein [Frankiales bacterium]